MNGNFLFGMIHVSTNESIQEVLNRSHRYHLEIYRVTEKGDKVEFFCHIEQKKQLLNCFPDAKKVSRHPRKNRKTRKADINNEKIRNKKNH